MRTVGLFVLLFVLLVSTVSASSHAQSAPELERAKTSFKAGANAYAAGDYLAAIQALELAYRLTPLPAIAFSLAQAERKQYFVDEDRRHLERAVALFNTYLEQATRGARREDASLALAQLEPLLGNATVSNVPAATPAARPTRLMIVAESPGARIALDGGALHPSPLIREVTPGRHRARVVASGFHDVERDVTAVSGELILTEVQLAERPSSLFVVAPASADIYLDGAFVGQGGARLAVQLPRGVHQLAVARKGRKVAHRTLYLEPGASLSVQVGLEATLQRRLSEVLFIAGGAALGTGIVLSGFAVRSENGAERFLAKSARRNPDSSELVSYHASLNSRELYRTATAVSFAGAVGLFITGLFLHELDRPNPEDTRRTPALTPSPTLRSARAQERSPSSRGPQNARTHLHLAPLITGEDWGATLQVAF